jgi:hypothetical protein
MDGRQKMKTCKSSYPSHSFSFLVFESPASPARKLFFGLKKTKKKSTQAKEYLVKEFLRKLTLEYSLPMQTQKVSEGRSIELQPQKVVKEGK